ncbi:MAG: alpha/beta fold hydrolase [Myxococcales bacterium]|nr:alpha/beta fold hydrolase [Myxococcales bacterium]
MTQALLLLMLSLLLWFGWALLLAAVGIAVQAADRNEPVAVDARLIALAAREAGARVTLTALGWMAFGRSRPVPVAPGDGQVVRRTPPVLLVPGLTWSRASLWPLRTFLRRRGFSWVWATDRGGRERPLAAEANDLARTVEELARAAGTDRVDIVAFSTGGLVAAWYLRHHGSDRVRRLVTLGTAWKGTRMAVFGRGRGVEELRFGGHALDGLWPPPVPTTCVHSPDDPVVVPASSAAPEHGGDVVAVESAGHVDMLMSARVYRAVQVALSAGEPVGEPA